MCCSNKVGACKVPRVGCNVICRITSVVGLALVGKDIVFGFWPLGNGPIFIGGFLKDDILACVET
jgi:hypothetical protein